LAFQNLKQIELRRLGFLPLVFFIAQGLHYVHVKELGHMLWMCNIGNLLLSIGLFLEKPKLIRVAAIWLFPGVVVWFLFYILPMWGVFSAGQLTSTHVLGITSSTLAHIGGFVVGIAVLQRVKVDGKAWLYAFGWYFVVQLISRLFTAPALNVNLAHNIQAGWEQIFSSYFKFWLVLTAAVGVCLFLLGLLLNRLWPASADSKTTASPT
jgi:hypothetical protein